MIVRRTAPFTTPLLQRAAATPGGASGPGTVEHAPSLAIPEAAARDWIFGEPCLQDLQRDPVILAVLRRDGLSLADLHRAIALARSRLAPAAQRRNTSNAA